MNSVAVLSKPGIKTRVALSLEASSSRSSSKFIQMQVDLIKMPLLATGNPEGPLVIDINASGLRKTKSGFMPKIIIVGGSDKAREAKKSGNLVCNAWVGEKIATSTIDIFPKNHIRLSKEIFADTVADMLPATPPAVLEQVLDRPNNGLALGGFTYGLDKGYDVVDFGAPGSELNNPMLRLMLNVEEALAMYQTEKAEGVHKVVFTPYAPVPLGLINAGREAKIAAQSAGLDLDKFSVMDFLKWQHMKMTMKASKKVKVIDGVEMKASNFAYVGDEDDISTWACCTENPEAAMIELQATSYVPKKEKEEVKKKIEAAGGPHLGIGDNAKKHLDKIQTRNVKQSERKSLAKKGKALPDGSFPIKNKSDLANAKHAVGRAKNPSKAKAFINKRAKQLGEKKIGAVAPPQTMNINSKKK